MSDQSISCAWRRALRRGLCCLLFCLLGGCQSTPPVRDYLAMPAEQLHRLRPLEPAEAVVGGREATTAESSSGTSAGGSLAEEPAEEPIRLLPEPEESSWLSQLSWPQWKLPELRWPKPRMPQFLSRRASSAEPGGASRNRDLR